MRIQSLAAAALLIPQLALAGSFTGTMAEGGGDARVINVKGSNGQMHYAYCGPGKVCDSIFYYDDHDDERIKKELLGKRVTVHFATEGNRGRVAGPGDDETVRIVKKIVFEK